MTQVELRADFRGYSDARNWGEEVADCHDCELTARCVQYPENRDESKRTES